MLKQPITVTITVKKSLILEFDKADQPEESRFLDAIWQKDKSPFVYTIFTNWHHDFICPSLPGVLSIIADHVYFSHRLPSWFLCQLSRWIINPKAGNHCRFNARQTAHGHLIHFACSVRRLFTARYMNARLTGGRPRETITHFQALLQQRNAGRSESLAVNGFKSVVFVLFLRHPHLLERVEAS